MTFGTVRERNQPKYCWLNKLICNKLTSVHDRVLYSLNPITVGGQFPRQQLLSTIQVLFLINLKKCKNFTMDNYAASLYISSHIIIHCKILALFQVNIFFTSKAGPR